MSPGSSVNAPTASTPVPIDTLPDSHAEILFDDQVFPVCSPDFAKAAGPVLSPEDLLSHSLISNDAEDPLWTGWNEWLSACSVFVPKRTLGLRCSFYSEAIHAALSGQGIALGWKSLVADLLDQRRLVRLRDAFVKPTGAYCAASPMKHNRKTATNAFLDWLRVSAKGPPDFTPPS